MKVLRNGRVFFSLLLALGLLGLAEAGFIVERSAAARMARQQREKAEREWRALIETQPAPTAENTGLIEADLARADQTVAELREALSFGAGTEPSRETPEPARRAQAFFDLAEFAASMRNRARQAGVIVRPDERFGFARYATDAPERGQLAALSRERMRVKYLLDALLEAKPREIISVQREAPVEHGRETGRPNLEGPGSLRGRAGTGSEYFALDARISRRVAGVVGTAAFRLSFTGQTEALRTLLNRLAEGELPVLVRSVEVAPLGRLSGDSRPGEAGTRPRIGSSGSRFTVTVEVIERASQPSETS